MWETEQNWRICALEWKWKWINDSMRTREKSNSFFLYLYRIDMLTHWTFRVVHMVVHLDRSTCCLDYFPPMQRSSPMVWIDSRARYFWLSPLFRMTMAISGTNLCHTHSMWYFWWCAAGKWNHRYHSNGYRLVLSNAANIPHRCTCQWYRIVWHHSRQRKLLHDPIRRKKWYPMNKHQFNSMIDLCAFGGRKKQLLTNDYMKTRKKQLR